MARKAGATKGKLSTLAVNAATKPGMIGDGNGLYLKIDESGSKSWILRYKLHGRSRKFGLGATHTVGLALARDKAADARRLLLEGKDPIEERKKHMAALALEAAKTITFDACVKQYFEAMKVQWKNAKHTADWEWSLASFASPVLGKLAVADIDQGLIVRALKPIWTMKPVTASRVRQRIESVLDYAKANGWRSGENPARWRGNLKHILPAHTQQILKKKHHAAMPWSELPDLIAKLRKRDEIGAHALLLTIANANRAGEVINARWDEFDLDRKIWTIPAAKMKAGKEHVVPLSSLALDVLTKMQAIRDESLAPDFVFPGTLKRGVPMAENSMRRVLQDRLGYSGTTIHGFRSSFTDWAHEHKYSEPVIEAALAHQVSDEVKKAYQRTTFEDARRELMKAWAMFLTSPPSATVIPMRRGKGK